MGNVVYFDIVYPRFPVTSGVTGRVIRDPIYTAYRIEMRSGASATVVAGVFKGQRDLSVTIFLPHYVINDRTIIIGKL